MRKKEPLDLHEEKIDRFIREKVMEAADLYEQELNNDPALQGLEPSPQVFENIMAQIRKKEEEAKKGNGDGETACTESLEREAGYSGFPDESAATAELRDKEGCLGEEAYGKMPTDVEALLSAEDRRALEIGRKRLKHRGRRRLLHTIGIAAALVIIVFGISMVSEANRIRLMNALNTLVGKEGIVQLDNEEDRLIIGIDEREAREQIRKKLDVAPVEFMYRPDGLEFEGYSLDEKTKVGILFYKYNDTVLSVQMVNKEEGSSLGMSRDGEVVDSFFVDAKVCEVLVSEIEGPGELDYMAEFEYKNCYYMIYGILPREEFVKLIEKILIF